MLDLAALDRPIRIVSKPNAGVSATRNFGASLAKGSYANGIIRCPWHGACFNAASGDIEDFPGLDSLYKYQVEVEGGEVKVKVDRSQLGKTKRTKKLVDKDPESKEVIVIVGGGAAAQVCYDLWRVMTPI